MEMVQHIWKEISKEIYVELKGHLSPMRPSFLLSIQNRYFILEEEYNIIFVEHPEWLIPKGNIPHLKLTRGKKQRKM